MVARSFFAQSKCVGFCDSYNATVYKKNGHRGPCLPHGSKIKLKVGNFYKVDYLGEYESYTLAHESQGYFLTKNTRDRKSRETSPFTTVNAHIHI
jgi:hypothetical protein